VGRGADDDIGSCDRIVLELFGDEAERVEPVGRGQPHLASAHEDEVESVRMGRAVASVVVDEVVDTLRTVEPPVVERVGVRNLGFGHESRGVRVRVLVDGRADDARARVGDPEALAREGVLLGRREEQKTSLGENVVENTQPERRLVVNRRAAERAFGDEGSPSTVVA
jgi:hypothetical protein